MTTNAAQGRGRQALLCFGKCSLAKDAKFIGVLGQFGAFILIVNSMLCEKWFSAASCLYWVGSKSSVNPAYTSNNLDYYLQPASLKSHADAERLRARLALKGFKSITQVRASEEKGTLYRVRLRPYTDKRKVKTAKKKLEKLSLRPFVFTVKKHA